MYQVSEQGGQGQTEKVQLEAGIAGQAGPCCQDPASYGLVQHNSLSSIDRLIDHHPVVVQRVACLGHV